MVSKPIMLYAIIPLLLLVATIYNSPVYAILGLPESADNVTTQSQSSESPSTQLLTYENSDFGFRVQYPINWIRHETDISGSFSNKILGAFKDTGVARPVVDFCPSAGAIDSSSITSISPCTFKKDSISVSVFDGLKKSDRSLDSFTEKQINHHTTVKNVIINSEPTTISGLPAQKILYTVSGLGNTAQKRIEMWTIQGDRAYVINYNPTGQQFDISPDAQKIIGSFQITQ